MSGAGKRGGIAMRMATASGFAALALSVVAIAGQAGQYDSVGIIVAALAVLVTALVGNQIYNVALFREKLEEQKREIRDEYSREIRKAKDRATGICLAQFAVMMSQQDNPDFGIVLNLAVNSLSELNESADGDDLSSEAYGKVVDLLYDISQKNLTDSGIRIESKVLYLTVAARIRDAEKRESILRFIDGLLDYD